MDILGRKTYTEREDQNITKVFLDNLYWVFYWADSVSTNLFDVLKRVADNNTFVLYHR